MARIGDIALLEKPEGDRLPNRRSSSTVRAVLPSSSIRRAWCIR